MGEFVLSIVALDYRILQYVDVAFRSDRDVVLAAVGGNCSALQYAADVLRADKDIILAAVAISGLALKHAAPHLRADKDVVIRALKKDAGAFKYAADPLRSDSDIRNILSGQALINDNTLTPAAYQFSADCTELMNRCMTLLPIIAIAVAWVAAELDYSRKDIVLRCSIAIIVLCAGFYSGRKEQTQARAIK